MSEIFCDIRVRGTPTSPTAVRAYCRVCNAYRTIKIEGSLGRLQLHCERCETLERYDSVEATPI